MYICIIADMFYILLLDVWNANKISISISIYHSERIILISGLVELVDIMMLRIIDMSLPVCEFIIGGFFK
jgi:hypothetical protein